ncbi:15671_t:CDS:10, partial [Cetraspora pellucida]
YPDKAIEEHKKDVIAPKTKAPFVPEIYSDAPTISEEEALYDIVCDELDVPKEEIIPTTRKNVTHEKLKSLEFPSLFSTAIVLYYLKKIAPKHKDHWKERYNKACEYVVGKITEKANKDEPIVKHYKTIQALILDKHIEDVISNDKEPDQKDKEAAFVIIQERVTPEVCEAITSAADDDGRIELNETVCKELDQWKDKHDKARDYLSKQIGDAGAEKELLDFTDNYVVDNCAKKTIKDNKRSGIVHVQTSTPDKCEDVVPKQNDDGSFELSDTICKGLEIPTEEKEIVTTVKSSTPNPKLKSPESDPWWKKALTLNPTTEKELLGCTNKYAIDKARDKAVKNNVQDNIYVTKLNFDDDTARAPVNADTALCDSQLEDGSFTLSPLINDHLNINPDDAIKSLKRFVCSPRLRGCDDSVWHTSFTIYYLKNILPDHENVWCGAYDHASKWLTKQIDDEKLEKELFSACKQYLIKQGIFDYLRSEGTADIARSLGSAQESNGTFSPQALTTLHPLIPSPESAVESLKLFATFTIYYLNNVLVDYEDEWRNACERARTWINDQIEDPELEKELYSACEQYLIQQGVDFINNEGGMMEESQEEVDIIVLQVSDETRKAVHKSLCDDVTDEVAHTLFNSQEKDGSFTLHKKILTISKSIQSITLLNLLNVMLEKEWKPACERAETWISQKCKSPEEEKELYSACDQFLIKQGIEVLNEKNRQPRLSKRLSAVKGETIQVITLVADDETRKAVYDFLRSQASPDHPHPRSYVGEPTKRYVHSPTLRGYKYEPEWQSARQRASAWALTFLIIPKKQPVLPDLLMSHCGVLSPKDAYLNSELIVVGASYTADRKLKQSYTESRNWIKLRREDVLQRAKRAARFLIDEYFDMKDEIDEYCISPTRYGSDSEKSLSNNLEKSDNDKAIT